MPVSLLVDWAAARCTTSSIALQREPLTSTRTSGLRRCGDAALGDQRRRGFRNARAPSPKACAAARAQSPDVHTGAAMPAAFARRADLGMQRRRVVAQFAHVAEHQPASSLPCCCGQRVDRGSQRTGIGVVAVVDQHRAVVQAMRDLPALRPARAAARPSTHRLEVGAGGRARARPRPARSSRCGGPAAAARCRRRRPA